MSETDTALNPTPPRTDESSNDLRVIALMEEHTGDIMQEDSKKRGAAATGNQQEQEIESSSKRFKKNQDPNKDGGAHPSLFNCERVDNADAHTSADKSRFLVLSATIRQLIQKALATGIDATLKVAASQESSGGKFEDITNNKEDSVCEGNNDNENFFKRCRSKNETYAAELAKEKTAECLRLKQVSIIFFTIFMSIHCLCIIILQTQFNEYSYLVTGVS